ncbi:MAG: substrate-binding domain-containing protein [Iamia sp.]
MQLRAGRATGAVAVALVLLAACGNDNSDAYAELTDAQADPAVSGDVAITGSSTVEPISTFAAQAFFGQSGQVSISVEGPGTGDGMENFCGGDADITGASRPIKAEELAACGEAGIEVIELPVGLDGIAVVASPDNPVECLSFADLYALIGPEATGVDQWSGAADLAGTLGSETDFPDENLVLTGPGEESGTYDSFLEQVIEPVAEERAEAGAISEDAAGSARADYASSANDNTIIDAVASDSGGLGWVGFAFAAESPSVRLVPIAAEPGEPCVPAEADTIRDGSYPISRTLFIYVNEAKAEEDPAVAAFVDFYLAGLDDFVALAEYVDLADPDATREVWDARTTGTRQG